MSPNSHFKKKSINFNQIWFWKSLDLCPLQLSINDYFNYDSIKTIDWNYWWNAYHWRYVFFIGRKVLDDFLFGWTNCGALTSAVEFVLFGVWDDISIWFVVIFKKWSIYIKHQLINDSNNCNNFWRNSIDFRVQPILNLMGKTPSKEVIIK